MEFLKTLHRIGMRLATSPPEETVKRTLTAWLLGTLAISLAACASKISTGEAVASNDDAGPGPTQAAEHHGDPGCPPVTPPEDGPGCATTGSECHYACPANPFQSLYRCNGIRWQWEASSTCQVTGGTVDPPPVSIPPMSFEAGPAPSFEAGPGPIFEAGPAPSTFAPPAACSLPEQGLISTPGPGTLPGLIIGSWLLCQQPSTFGTSDEIGLEIAADGSFYKLYRSPAGTLERGVGFNKQGHWEIVDDRQLNLNVDGQGTAIILPQFATTPRKMRLNNFGVFIADYIIAN
jgi:hypothetical protein